ncbi:MAG: hypothetical protein HYX47_02030 [Burkholderiales bacterium]|nr:hypothetical protein [Burkholderiales bacterium]
MNFANDDIAGHQIEAELCEPIPQAAFEDSFQACLNARGVYESQKFALRLSPLVHELVESAVAKAESGSGKLTSKELQAYSTFIHETVHWWQHKGSTSGFVRSLLYPLQAHSHIAALREILQSIGPEKPIINVALKGELGLFPEHAEAIIPVANTVANDFMDTEFFLAQTLSPTLAQTAALDRYFQSTGHSCLIAYSMVLGALRQLIDKEGAFLDSPEVLVDTLGRLREKKTTGYFPKSSITLPPIGVRDLYEGQARFIQLQFLNATVGLKTFQQARDEGMLEGVYGSAFDVFLTITDSKEPNTLSDPLVALFLLVCDMSINPTAGFPAKIDDFDYFYFDVDPGIRFATLAMAVKALPDLKTHIVEYSVTEYRHVVKMLSAESGLSNHLLDLATFMTATKASDAGRKLIEEQRTYEFSPSDIVLRVLVGEFLSFAQDRLDHPEFFCWAGHWMTEGAGHTRELWLGHLSLATDRHDEKTLYPRLRPGVEERVVSDVFNQFFAAVILFDLTKQWVLTPGGFDIDYSWLTAQSSEPEFSERVAGVFEMHYGVNPSQFRSIPDPRL